MQSVGSLKPLSLLILIPILDCFFCQILQYMSNQVTKLFSGYFAASSGLLDVTKNQCHIIILLFETLQFGIL